MSYDYADSDPGAKIIAELRTEVLRLERLLRDAQGIISEYKARAVEVARTDAKTMTDHKWFDPECGAKGCQSLIWKGLYESAVQGRRDFRQAYREARDSTQTLGVMEATQQQHVGRPKGEPARFVRNGKLEICQCLDCRALAQKVQGPAMNVEDARRLANKVQDYIFQNDPFGDVFSQKDLQDVYIAIVAGPPAQAAPEPVSERGACTVHNAITGLDGKWCCQNCGETIEMAVALPSPPATLPAGR